MNDDTVRVPPEAEDVPGLVLRRYRGEEDLQLIVDVYEDVARAVWYTICYRLLLLPGGD